MNTKTKHRGQPKTLEPQTPAQSYYLHLLQAKPVVISTGYAGTGKTFVAASYAAERYREKAVRKIIVTRPNVSAGPTLGYLPGTQDEKMEPWAVPVMSILRDRLGHGMVDTGIKHENIVVAPLETMRGHTFDNAFVLLDEAQNTTVEQIKMLCTRIGKHTKLIINGDVRQKDVKGSSGLAYLLRVAGSMDDVGTVDFSVDDIVRSALVKQFIIEFEKHAS